MRLLVMKQVGCAFVHVFLVLLAALALSGAPTQPAHADPQRLLAPDPPFEFTSHREISGSQLNAFNASLGPALSWNTFLGGSGSDDASGIATDASGNVYVIGTTNATWGSPKRPYSGSFDASVAKLSPSGELLWNTFLGGSGFDWGSGIALDGDGNIYASGDSGDLWESPLSGTQYVGPFVAKLSPSGTLAWSTFVGDGLNSGGLVATDKSGNVYVSAIFEVTPMSPEVLYDTDVSVFKLDSNGTTLWNTLLGGAGVDQGGRMASDGDGNLYISGWSDATWGSPIRDYTSMADAFVAKVDAQGELVWNTFLGGSGIESTTGIAVDAAGNAYLTGVSSATWGSPIRAYTNLKDAFVAKLSPNGNLTWNTFLGGSGNDDVLVVDASSNIVMAGTSTATWGSPARPYSSDYDAFAAGLDPSGTLVWSTFLGGAGVDHGTGIAMDGKMNVYVTGISNATWGSPLRAFASPYDTFVARIDPFHLDLPLVTK